VEMQRCCMRRWALAAAKLTALRRAQGLATHRGVRQAVERLHRRRLDALRGGLRRVASAARACAAADAAKASSLVRLRRKLAGREHASVGRRFGRWRLACAVKAALASQVGGGAGCLALLLAGRRRRVLLRRFGGWRAGTLKLRLATSEAAAEQAAAEAAAAAVEELTQRLGRCTSARDALKTHARSLRDLVTPRVVLRIKATLTLSDLGVTCLPCAVRAPRLSGPRRRPWRRPRPRQSSS